MQKANKSRSHSKKPNPSVKIERKENQERKKSIGDNQQKKSIGDNQQKKSSPIEMNQGGKLGPSDIHKVPVSPNPKSDHTTKAASSPCTTAKFKICSGPPPTCAAQSPNPKVNLKIKSAHISGVADHCQSPATPTILNSPVAKTNTNDVGNSNSNALTGAVIGAKSPINPVPGGEPLPAGTTQVALDKGVIILKKPEAVITDIEGTITSTMFWETELGPVVWMNLRDCLINEWNSVETKDVVNMIKKQMSRMAKTHRHVFELPEKKAGAQAWAIQIFRYFKHSMDNQLFTDDIVALQVLVSFYCYKKQICKGHIYEDAVKAFKRWHDNDIPVGVFSSGIVLAQQMLIYYSRHGNISKYIKEYFSATIEGEKSNPQSYIRVARRIGASPSSIIYVSDNPKELAAANEAGLYPVLIIREHNTELIKKPEKVPFKFIQSFDQLRFVQIK